jgi:hypothetical protein
MAGLGVGVARGAGIAAEEQGPAAEQCVGLHGKGGVIRRWVRELVGVPVVHLHEPWTMAIQRRHGSRRSGLAASGGRRPRRAASGGSTDQQLTLDLDLA